MNEILAKIDQEISDYEKEESVDINLEQKNVEKIKHLISNTELKTIIEKIHDPLTYQDFTYSNLIDFADQIKQLDEQIQIAKEEIELEEFYKRGEVLDFDKLRKLFKDRRLKTKFPKFDFEKYESWFKNPKLELPNFSGEIISYDRFLVKKLLIGVNQMIFSEMDLYINNVGKEGSGKSCFSSQVLLYLYTFLYDVGLIDYEYDIKKMFFSSLRSMLEAQESQEENDYFRLMVLDEAYELNRQNFREESSKEYKDDMRSSRKMLRIVILNLPQLGELETAITLTRVNFIFYADMDSMPKLGIVRKGLINMYIIPRGKKIYSPFQRRNISDEEIVNSINKTLKDKNDAYKGLPKNVLISKLNFINVWGFDKEIYDKYIKLENKKKRMNGTIRLSDYVGYIMFKKLPAIKNWNSFDMKDKKDKRMYFTIQKWLRTNITNRYIMNPELITKYDLLYQSESKE